MEPGIRLKARYSKADIRRKVWDYLEKKDLADYPRPVHHRIPNFKHSFNIPDEGRITLESLYFKCNVSPIKKGASHACENLLSMKEFSLARTVKINPDSPQKNARFLALEANKILLVPTPRLRHGLFNRITPPSRAGKNLLRICSTPQGAKEYSERVGLDDSIKVDMVIVGSVAVSEKGWRIGKGEGYADLEYAMMATIGAVTKHTVVVSVVHDCQVLDFPEKLLGDHDLTVDYILTPTRIIKTNCTRPKPQGIIWSMLTWEMMCEMPILKKLHGREKIAGKNTRLKSDRALRFDVPDSDSGDVSTLYIGNIPPTTRLVEFKEILQDRGAPALQVNWQIAYQRAFLIYPDPRQAREALRSLKGLIISTTPLWVNMARPRQSKEDNVAD